MTDEGEEKGLPKKIGEPLPFAEAEKSWLVFAHLCGLEWELQIVLQKQCANGDDVVVLHGCEISCAFEDGYTRNSQDSGR